MVALEKLLEESRRELLDLSTRNRLLAIPVESKSAQVIHVRDEKCDPFFRFLVTEGKAMGILPGIENRSSAPTEDPLAASTDFDEDEAGLPQPDDESDESGGEARRHDDTNPKTA